MIYRAIHRHPKQGQTGGPASPNLGRPWVVKDDFLDSEGLAIAFDRQNKTKNSEEPYPFFQVGVERNANYIIPGVDPFVPRNVDSRGIHI